MEEVKPVIFELPKVDNELLLTGVMGLSLIHGIIFPDSRSPVIFNSESFRKWAFQYPWEIESKTIYFKNFNFKDFDYKSLREQIESSSKEKLLIYRDKNGELINNLYLGRKYMEDPYTRLVYTTNFQFKDYYKRDDVKIFSQLGKQKFLNQFT